MAIDTWGEFCHAAENEINAPGALTDVAGLASMSASGRLRRADFFELLGESAVASVERETAAALIASYGEPSAQLEVRRTLANSLKVQARYGEALAEFAAIDASVDADANPVTFARVALDRAMLLEWLGDFERVEAELAAVERRIGDRLDTAPAPEGLFATLLGAVTDATGTEERVALQSLRMEITMTRAMVAKRRGHLDDAHDLFGSIRDDYVAWGTGAAIDFHLMHVEAMRGQTKEAMNRLAGLDAEMRSDPRFHAKIPVLHWVAAEAMVDHDPQWALTRVGEGLPVLEHVGDLEVLWKLYRTAANSLAALGRGDEATTRFVDAARTVDMLRRVPLGYRLESTYFADRRPLFVEAVSHATTQSAAGAAFELTELSKSRSLATLVYGGRLSLDANPKSQHVDDLSRQIDAWDFRSFNGEQVDTSERRQLVTQRRDSIEQIRASDPRWRSITEPPQVAPAVIGDALDGAIAVSLFVAGEAIVAVTIDNGETRVDHHHVSADVWHEVDAYCDNVRRAEDPWAYDLSGFGEVTLADLLPEPTIERVLAHDRAVIAPHDKLHLVPWSSLQTSPGRRLFEDVGVTTMPNLMSLAALSGTWATHPRVSIVGAPDYNAVAGLDAVDEDGREYKALRALWESTGASLHGATLGSASTETALRMVLAGSSELVHISCHGVVDHSEPSASALVATDGKVDAAEIALGGSCPDEVVLAACSTGYRPQAVGGVVLSGDDVVGLPAAFLEAGARSIIMSIPEAHDATSIEFMTRYHRLRSTGSAPVDAFRATQVEMLEVADPALWCGYVMYGAPSNQLR